MAWWQSGYAEDCKSLYAGSIPTQASNFESDKCRFFSLFSGIFLYLQNGAKIFNLTGGIFGKI